MKQSYWQAEAGPSSTPQRRAAPSNADVAIIGGGLAGLTTAIRIKERDPGLDVAVLEGKFVGFGASGRNGGLLSPLAAPLLIVGAEESGEQLWALTRLEREIQKAADWIAETLPDGESRRVNLRLEAKGRLSDSGVERVARVLDRADIGYRLAGSNGAKAQRTLELNANTVHPFRLVRALAGHAESLGARVYEGASVSTIEETERGSALTLASGQTISARTVVVAANAYAWTIDMPVKVPGKAVYNFMIAAKPVERADLQALSPDGTFNVELNSTYAFYRAHGERLIYGGIEQFSQQTPDDIDVPDKVLARLERLMANSFPGTRPLTVERAWGGKFHVTSTDMPIIRRAAGSRAIVLNVGYGGTGVAMTLACARLAAGVVCGSQIDGDDERLLGVMQKARFPVWGGVKFVTGVALGAVAATLSPGAGSGDLR